MTPEHYEFVYQLVVSEPSAFKVLFPGRTPDLDAFGEQFQEIVGTCFVVIGIQTRRPLGVAYFYQWSAQHGIAFFQVTMTPSFRGFGVGIEAAHLFVNYAFRSFNIRKLYVSASTLQMKAIRSGLGGILEEEGRLREHSYFEGRWQDEHIIAIRRERYEECAATLRPIRVHPTSDDDAGRETPSSAAPSSAPSPTRWRRLGAKTGDLDGPRVRLEAAGNKHGRYLYELATAEGVGYRWRFGGAVPTVQEFQRLYRRGVFAQFVALSRNGRPFGHLVAYQADLANGHVYVGGVTDATFHRTGYPMDAFVILIRYLFKNWNFRKVYMELAEFNRAQILSAGVIDGLREEARLRDVIYQDGSWWDRSVFAVSRTFFMSSLGCEP